MLLVIDIGNTNIVVGAFRKADLQFELRFKTDPGRTVDEYVALLSQLFQRHLGAKYEFNQCIISSVVPPVTPDVIRVIQTMLGLEPLVVGPGIKTGIQIRVQDPTSVGSDRIVNAVAAKELFGFPNIVIDFGTATSFDVVGKDGAYEGGIIVPGVQVSLDSLVRNTAKLPRIELAWPTQVIGKGTVQAMQSGSVLGYLCLVDGLVEKIIEELGPVKKVVATGGLGRLFASHSKRIGIYDQHLTLTGLRLLAELNSESHAK